MPTPHEQEARDIYGLRLAIGQQMNIHRGRYGNKDGTARDGEYRRFDDADWATVEGLLKEADGKLFAASQILFNKKNVTPPGRSGSEPCVYPDDDPAEAGSQTPAA